MPARQLADKDEAPAFAVVGIYGRETVVRHVALLSERTVFTADCAVSVYEMGPPLVVDSGGVESDSDIDVIGWVDSLSDSQREGMVDWIQNLRTWLADPLESILVPKKYRDYVVVPASMQFRDEASGREIRRFSCAGFVDSCYAKGAQLSLIDHAELPLISFAELQEVWWYIRSFRDAGIARKLKLKEEEAKALAVQCGLDGEGPWHILLPGYLLHSLARDDYAHPYKPVAGDHSFGKLLQNEDNAVAPEAPLG